MAPSQGIVRPGSPLAPQPYKAWVGNFVLLFAGTFGTPQTPFLFAAKAAKAAGINFFKLDTDTRENHVFLILNLFLEV